MYTSKNQLKEQLRKQITSSSEQAIKAMLRVFEYQTDSEQECADVVSRNGVGFVSNDAKILTSFCKQYQKSGYLSDKQVSLLIKKIGKYAGQLLEQAIEKGMYVKEGKEWIVAKH